MPESKKISELPAFSTVQAGDILPVVDATLTQTGKCTAAQIAAIGGGPPGANIVTNQHVKDGGLQARKLGFTNFDRIPYSTTTTETIEGETRYRCTETTLTPYARELLSKVNATAAWQHLSASPNFSGPISVPPGGPTNPSYTFTGSNNSGLFLIDDSVCISANGQMLYMFSINRDMYSLQAGSPAGQLSPAIPFRAYTLFKTGTQSTQITLDTSREVGEFLGFSNYQDSNGDWNGPNIWNGGNVQVGLQNGCISRGVTYVSHQSQDKNGRSNYTSPGDNSLIELDAAGTSTPAPGSSVPYNVIGADNKTWVGTMIYATSASAPQLESVRNVTSVAAGAGNLYTINFTVPMPDYKYGVVGIVETAATSTGVPGVIRVKERHNDRVVVVYDNVQANDRVFIGVVR